MFIMEGRSWKTSPDCSGYSVEL